MIFERFDRIYVINLPDRPDRRAEMEGQLNRWSAGHHADIEFFDAIRMETPGPFLRLGSHGAFLSYLAVLQKELDTGRTVLILQDDCNFNELCRHPLPDDWDIFYGGFMPIQPGDPMHADIIGAHCMGYKPSAIPPLEAWLRSVYKSFPDDPAVKMAPIDGSIVDYRRAHPQVRALFREVSYQRSSKTDIGDASLIDKVPAIARPLRRLCNMLR